MINLIGNLQNLIRSQYNVYSAWMNDSSVQSEALGLMSIARWVFVWDLLRS